MGSREFLLGAKLGRKKALKSRLKRCKYHVYDFDNLGQTALHWAAKRNNPDICDLLMEYGANPNVPDLAGRTPVFVASKVGSMEALRVNIYSIFIYRHCYYKKEIHYFDHFPSTLH